MKVFVYEHLCAVETGSDAAASLLVEGHAMLSAVLTDFARIAGVSCVTLINDRSLMSHADLPAVPFHGDAEKAVFLRLAADADFTLVIAPEFDDILLSRCRWVKEAGGRLLGPSLDAITLTADKLRLAEHWTRHSISTPPCRLLPPITTGCPSPTREPGLALSLADASGSDQVLVIKPRYGAGSQTTFLVEDSKGLEVALGEIGSQPHEFVVQPFLPGQAASVAFLIGPRQTVALAPAVQRLSEDGRFRYLGGALPLGAPLAGRAVCLASRAVAAVNGLYGYVGVDLVLGADAEGADDVTIEINPRLTTSYVGLRALAERNLAEVLLQVASGEWVADLAWKTRPVQFFPGGRLDLPE